MNNSDSINSKQVLTGKQMMFCREYIRDFNGSRAAMRAGYAEKSSRVVASNLLSTPKISEYLKQILKEAHLGPEETTKLISDIAKGSLNDYFVIRKAEYTPKVVKSLKVLINEIDEEIDFEEEFANEAGLTDDQYAEHMNLQNSRRLKKLRYQLELKRNPKGTRIVPGESVLVDHPELDMARLVKDKEAGKIKSITPTMFGTKIEMYAADAALANLAKIHGLFAPEQHQLTGKDGKPLIPEKENDLSALSDEEKAALLLIARKVDRTE